MIGFGNVWKDCSKLGRVVRAKIGGHLHPGNENGDVWVVLFGPINNGLQIFFNHRWLNAPKAVIGPELYQQDINLLT